MEFSASPPDPVPCVLLKANSDSSRVCGSVIRAMRLDRQLDRLAWFLRLRRISSSPRTRLTIWHQDTHATWSDIAPGWKIWNVLSFLFPLFEQKLLLIGRKYVTCTGQVGVVWLIDRQPDPVRHHTKGWFSGVIFCLIGWRGRRVLAGMPEIV